MPNIKKFHIIALAALGGGLSGGDRIFIEFARRWSKKNPVTVYVWEEGQKMCQRERLDKSNAKIKIVKVGRLSTLGFVFTYFYRIFLGIKLAFRLDIKEGDYIYSASEFWMDALPAIISKIRKPKIKWITAWYQTAPNPLIGFTEGKREDTYKFTALLYWLIQKTIKPLIINLADFILVNNDLEKSQFNKSRAKKITVLGAVKIDDIIKYQKTHKYTEKKKYLAVFQGRFHPQKGVVELIDIWKIVTEKIPNATLALIGDGPLMKEVKSKIYELGLEGNTEFFGYLHDGEKKFSIFQNSKVVVHPAFFDSGGMASAEAMAFGLPCVAFDLRSYAFYYPKGMVKVQIGDNQAFANAIIRFDKDATLYRKIADEGRDMIKNNWSWDIRAYDILNQITAK